MAAPRRRRAGRRRKDGRRHPGGQIVREKVGATDQLLARRAELVGEKHARDQNAAWLPGQLFLRGVLTAEQAEAARRWHGWAVAYKKLLEGHRPVKALSLDMPRGGAPVDDPAAYARAKQRYDLCFEAISSRGRHVLRVAVDCVFHDRAGDVALIREGLEALRVRLGL
jgi:hypothetical protein